MKKRSLFLSLICSITLTVALVAVTIASVLPKKNANKPTNPSTNVSQTVGSVNNEANDGTAQKPFVLYDAKSFIEYVSANGGKLVPVMEAVQEPVMIEKLDENGEVVVDAEGNTVFVEKTDENGNVVYQNKLDENGNIVYAEKLDENGKVILEGCHFVLNNDIDFAGVDFKPLFNQDKPFVGNIDGKGYALVNILMNVTTENFVKNYAYVYEIDNIPCLEAHIGVFGNIENAKIENIAFENLSISIENEVYELVADAITVGDRKVTTLEITVGSVASMAKNSVIAADVDSVINAGAYSRYSNNSVDGFNSVGGVVSVANGTTIKDGKINVIIDAKQGSNYRVGGVAGYLYNSDVLNVEISANIVAQNKDQVLYIGGVAGFARQIEISDSKVELVVNGVGERLNTKVVSELIETEITKVAGIVPYIRANNINESAIIKNVEVNSDVNADVIFGGAIVEILSTNENYVDFEKYVEFVDVIVSSNVDVLEAFGFARQLKFTNITITENGYKFDVDAGVKYSTKITGNVRLNNTSKIIVASLFVKEMSDKNDKYFTLNGKCDPNELVVVQVITSKNITDKVAVWEYDSQFDPTNPLFTKISNYGIVVVK